MSDIHGSAYWCEKALERFDMIQPNDKIAVGVSGGKDSLTLLETLAKISTYYPIPFSVVAISVDMYNGKTDFSKVKELCEKLNVEFYVVNTNLYELLFEIRKEKNPCSLCSKIRRGALCNKAKELGCNKVALGHHADDLIETFFLSLYYEGRLSTFAPVSFMSRSQISIIRPLILVWERDISSHAKSLPVIHNPCPADKNTKREWIKSQIKDLGFKIPKVEKNILNAIINPERYHLFDNISPKDSEE